MHKNYFTRASFQTLIPTIYKKRILLKKRCDSDECKSLVRLSYLFAQDHPYFFLQQLTLEILEIVSLYIGVIVLACFLSMLKLGAYLELLIPAGAPKFIGLRFAKAHRAFR